jgi:hypothetical protein
MAMQITKAGAGDHNVYYPLKAHDVNPADTAPFEARKQYIGIDAVRWYLNEQGNLFHNRMASGTFEISLENETYSGGLGTYELKGQARTAPVFDLPILNNRVFRGGRISIKVYVKAIEDDTLLGSLLRDMSKASIGVLSGAISAATATGPLAALLTISGNLVAGVKKILEEGSRPVTVLEPSGVSLNVPLTELKGAQNYVLIHRGAVLKQAGLEVTQQGAVVDVLYEGQPLQDGAWILLRLRREDSYGDPRPWDKAAEEAREAIDGLLDSVRLGSASPDSAQKALSPGTPGSPSVYDKVMSVVNQVRADYALAEREAIKIAGGLIGLLGVAKKAIKGNEVSIYDKAREAAMKSLSGGFKPSGIIGAALENEAFFVSLDREPSLRDKHKAPELSGRALWRSLRYVDAKI